MVLFLGLTLRFAWIQLCQGEKLTHEAVALHSRQIELREYPRGEILDRNHLPLTDISTTTALYGFPREMMHGNYAATTGNVNDTQNRSWDNIVNLLEGSLRRRNQDSIKRSLYQATAAGAPVVRIASNLSANEVQRINQTGLSGLVIAPEIKRYRQDGFCAHLLGYVGGGVPAHGTAGLEKQYDGILSQDSLTPQLTSIHDARGQVIQGLMFRGKADNDLKKGALVLTLDKRVQQAAEDAANSRVGKGAIVVMDIKTKEILAMVSRPTFNPYNIGETIKNDKNGSLNNRALMSYPPGSLFKLLVATAAFEEGVVKIDDKFICTGGYRFNDQVTISCWNKEGHGAITFGDGFAQSCNSVFIETGLKLGKERLLKYVSQLHLTDENITGFRPGPMGTEVTIDVGDPALGNASIGQQGVMLSPVELCSLVSTIADNGYWRQPSLVAYTVDRNGGKHYYPAGDKVQVIHANTAATMRELMARVVTEGTGKSAALAEASVAGKTGTGQTGNIGNDNKELLNTWFAGYFPADQPRWAVVVLVEEGRSGSEDAAPVFKDIAKRMMDIFTTSKS